MSRATAPRARGVRAAGAAVAVAAVVVGGVIASARADGPAAAGARPGEPTGEVVVLAAASLAEPFERLAAELEADHPGLTVTLSVGPSSALAAQVAAGAPVDVLATASPATMATATRALTSPPGAEVQPVVVATNTLALAVPGPAAPGGPGDVSGLADLDGDVRYAVCQEQVPCGAGAAVVLAAAGVEHPPVTFEDDVGGVLTKVAFGEVDAGVVYASDVHPGAALVREGRVVGVGLGPAAGAWTTSYPVLALPDAPNPAGARAVLDLLTSERGAALLRDAGFGPPP